VIWCSTDHGAHFAGPYPVTGGANSQVGLALSSRPLVDPRDGRLFMLYEAGTSSGAATLLQAGMPVYEFPLTQLWLASSTNGGLTWSNRLVLDTSALAGSLRAATLGHLLVASAIDAAGDLYAAVSVRKQGETRTSIYLIHSADRGTTWSAPVAVVAPTSSNVMPALTVAPSGVAYLSWYGSSAADFRDGAARWFEMFAQSSDPLAAHPHFAVQQVSGSAPIHLGGIDTAGTVGSDSGANWGLRDFQSIAVDAAGRPHLVWADDNATSAAQTAYLAAGGASRRRGRPGRRHPLAGVPRRSA
jgi:hypothetical protein